MRTSIAYINNVDSEDHIVQEDDGSLTIETLGGAPSRATIPDSAIKRRLEALLLTPDASFDDRATSIPVAKSLAAKQSPRAADLTALDAAIAAQSKRG